MPRQLPPHDWRMVRGGAALRGARRGGLHFGARGVAEREAERVAGAGAGRPRDGMKVARLAVAAAALAASAQGVCRALWIAAPRPGAVTCV